jgi:hypothetical protein
MHAGCTYVSDLSSNSRVPSQLHPSLELGMLDSLVDHDAWLWRKVTIIVRERRRHRKKSKDRPRRTRVLTVTYRRAQRYC